MNLTQNLQSRELEASLTEEEDVDENEVDEEKK